MVNKPLIIFIEPSFSLVRKKGYRGRCKVVSIHMPILAFRHPEVWMFGGDVCGGFLVLHGEGVKKTTTSTKHQGKTFAEKLELEHLQRENV